MKIRKKLIENGCLKKDRDAFLQYLFDMGYTKKSLKHYSWIVKCLDQFMYENNQTEYTSGIGNAFLSESMQLKEYTPRILKVMHGVVRRFNCFMGKEEFVFVVSNIDNEIPVQFVKEVNGYLRYMEIRGLSHSTIEQRREGIQKALLKLNAKKIYSFAEFKTENLYEIFQETTNKQSFCDSWRGFLRYLFETKVTEIDFSIFVPSYKRKKPTPSIYTSTETDILLNTLEENECSAKRNTAIILLALRLGMRSGDIANLKVSDVNFNSKTINFIQEKTKIPQCLELLPEVEDALLIYLTDVRPTSNISNVFLTIKSPIRAIGGTIVHKVISRRLGKAGIDTSNRKHGGHALRMTFASELVSEKVPYDVIRKILGHQDPNAINHYVKFDIEALRLCAIEVPMVTGKLATHMGITFGGEPQ